MMNKKEINEFIEEMQSIGDIWTKEQVKQVYGNKTLEEALSERKNDVGMHLTNIFKVFTSLSGKDDE